MSELPPRVSNFLQQAVLAEEAWKRTLDWYNDLFTFLLENKMKSRIVGVYPDNIVIEFHEPEIPTIKKWTEERLKAK